MCPLGTADYGLKLFFIVMYSTRRNHQNNGDGSKKMPKHFHYNIVVGYIHNNDKTWFYNALKMVSLIYFIVSEINILIKFLYFENKL